MKEGKTHAVGTPEEVLTRSIISDVYGIEVSVEKGGAGGGVRIAPISGKARQHSAAKGG